jgi:tripartite-type tricarboxylate transporter receptor subunit TctC
MADLLGGHVKLMMDSTASALSAIHDGRIKALGVTTKQRAPGLEQVPPIGDTVAGYDSAGWSGLVAPAKTPDDIVNRVNADLVALMHDRAVLQQFDDRATLADPLTPAQFGAFIARDMATWAEVVKATGLKPGN